MSKDVDTYPKIRKYDIEASLWCRPRSSYLNSAIATESKIFGAKLQVYDINFENAKYEHSVPQKVSSEQPFPAKGRFQVPISSGGQKRPDSRGARAPPVHAAGQVAIWKAPGEV